MEKFLKVTVNGSIYDVKVEDVKPTEVVANPAVATVQPVASKKVEKTEQNNVSVPSSSKLKITAPMPGSIWKIKTSVGAKVAKHEVLLILEAMKMENEIVAPEEGTVTAILIKEGDPVEAGKVIVELG